VDVTAFVDPPEPNADADADRKFGANFALRYRLLRS
jgi:hypothetical protein